MIQTVGKEMFGFAADIYFATRSHPSYWNIALSE